MPCKDTIFKDFNRKQKAQLFVGKSSWELEPIAGKSIFVSDGPHGIRKEVWKNGQKQTVKAVCYPAAVLSACSFDVDLMKELGEELAKECISHKIDVLLGPGINIKRNPLCGRNFEYFSEDPYLSGKLASAYIQGVQSKNVGVSLKHYALNSQEYARLVNDSIVDDRAMREIYLKAFEIAIKESDPWTIMAAYNKVNGYHATENKELLTEIAREEFGFEGVFISDWGALWKPVEGLKAGLDLEMPGLSKGSETRILEAIENGEIKEELLNQSTRRLIDLYEKTEQPKKAEFDFYHALALAKRINDESIVLLKNEDDLLPLQKEQKIALIGDFCLCPRYQGGGSSQINPIYVSDIYSEMKRQKIDFSFAKGYDSEDAKPKEELIEQAKKAAKGKDAVIVVCGLPRMIESEGFDREDMKLPQSQLRLLEEVAKVNSNLVIVLQNGAPVEMPFAKNARAILESYLGGSMHAISVCDILYGRVNPSGRLAESFPLSYEDVPSQDYYCKERYQSPYKESVYVGYRYYDSFDKKVLFPFGYGLGYAKVEYSDFKVEKVGEEYRAYFCVTNHSAIPAKEVVQLYVGQTDSNIFKAKKELKAFTKVALQPGEKKMLHLQVKEEDLRYYSLKRQSWQLENGNYRFYLAKHAMDESRYVDVQINSGQEPEDKNPEWAIYYSMHRNIKDKEFASLLGRKWKKDADSKTKSGFGRKQRKTFTTESVIDEFFETFLGWLVFKPLAFYMIATSKDDFERQTLKKAIPDFPLRILQMSPGLSKDMLDGIVAVFNGDWKKVWKVLRTKK